MLSVVYLAQEQNTVSVERRFPIGKIRISARERTNPIALFWCLAAVLVKDCFGDLHCRSLKFLADVNRDVFILTKFLATPWRIKELICVISLRAWSKMDKVSKAIRYEKNI